jgi:hypothetical protein
MSAIVRHISSSVCVLACLSFAQHDRERSLSRLETELAASSDALQQAQHRAGEAVAAYEQARVESEALRQALNSRHVDKLVCAPPLLASLSSRWEDDHGLDIGMLLTPCR